MKRSGTNEADKIRLATAVFNKKDVSHPNEDVGPKFRFLAAWEALRERPKFEGADPTRGVREEERKERTESSAVVS